MLDPKTHCVACHAAYGLGDEVCPQCQFDPCDGGPGEAAQERAEKEWLERKS